MLWKRDDFECDHFRGSGSSPIIHGNLLILTFDGADLQYMAALDKRTGKTVWRTERSVDFQDLGADGKPFRDGDMRKGYSTPLVIRHGGKTQLISIGAMACYAMSLRPERNFGASPRGAALRQHRPVYGTGCCFTDHLPRANCSPIQGKGRGGDTHIKWRLSRSPTSRRSC